MRSLDFSDGAEVCMPRHRLTRRAWYAIFGAQKLEPDEKMFSADLATRIHTLYNDIAPEEIEGVITNYLEERRQMNVES